MLKINKKEYEIEEEIQLLNEKDEIVFSFDMKLTADDLQKLKKVLIGKDTLKLASKIKSFENSDLDEEKTNEIIELADNMNKETESLIGKLCFKDNKDKFIELGGQAKYEEMVEVISDFLLGFFIKKQTARANTINTDLARISTK